jgi:hypothetical protein
LPAERPRKHRTAEREQSPICKLEPLQAPLDGKNSVYEIYAKGNVSPLVCVMAEPAELDTVTVEPCAVSRGLISNFPLSLHPEMLPREPRHLPDYPHLHVAPQHGESSGTSASRVRGCAHPYIPQVGPKAGDDGSSATVVAKTCPNMTKLIRELRRAPPPASPSFVDLRGYKTLTP